MAKEELKTKKAVASKTASVTNKKVSEKKVSQKPVKKIETKKTVEKPVKVEIKKSVEKPNKKTIAKNVIVEPVKKVAKATKKETVLSVEKPVIKKSSKVAKEVVVTDVAKKDSSEIVRMLIAGGMFIVLVVLSFFVALSKPVTKYKYQTHTGIEEIKVADYIDLINQDGISIIYIARPGCGYCNMFEPVLSGVLSKYNIGVEYINIEAISTQEEWDTFYNSNTFLSGGEWGTPTLMIYKDKKILNVNSGYVEEAKLIQFLKDNNIIEGE